MYGGQFRADVDGRASYAPVNMCKVHARKHRTKIMMLSVSRAAN